MLRINHNLCRKVPKRHTLRASTVVTIPLDYRCPEVRSFIAELWNYSYADVRPLIPVSSSDFYPYMVDSVIGRFPRTISVITWDIPPAVEAKILELALTRRLLLTI